MASIQGRFGIVVNVGLVSLQGRFRGCHEVGCVFCKLRCVVVVLLWGLV